jgi:hypothetical protein
MDSKGAICATVQRAHALLGIKRGELEKEGGIDSEI